MLWDVTRHIHPVEPKGGDGSELVPLLQFEQVLGSTDFSGRHRFHRHPQQPAADDHGRARTPISRRVRRPVVIGSLARSLMASA